MNAIKKILCVIGSTLCLTCVPGGTTYDVNAVTNTSKTDESYIYRNSFRYYAANTYDNTNGVFSVTTVARKNGHITVTLQGVDGQDFYAGEFFSLSFNDSIISDIGNVGYSGMSSLWEQHVGVSHIKQYEDNIVKYSVFYNDYSSYLIGEDIVTFDLYVNQESMNDNVTLYIADKTVDLPYGECGQSDFNPIISRLRNELLYQEDCNNKLKEELSLYKDHFGDINFDGNVDVRDAQIILNYYVSTLCGKNKELKDYASN